MKYYSEILKKNFDSEEDCLKAERNYQSEQKKIEEKLQKALQEKKAKDEELALSKKELATKIEEASAKVEEANNVYDAAKEKATAILNKAKEEAAGILDVAKNKVREAEKARYEALSAFNKKFGPYTTTLTGEKAAKEYSKAVRRFNDVFSDFLADIFRF